MADLDAVILASGLSRRMGTNKLLLPLGDSTVIGQLLASFPFAIFAKVIVVYCDQRVAAIAGAFPVLLLRNDTPERGKSRSIQLGLAAGNTAHGVMFAVADQPLLKPNTISTLVEIFSDNPDSIILPKVHGIPANPVIFPADLRRELALLEGDNGGREVIRRHPARVQAVPFSCGDEFCDIDTYGNYQDVVARWNQQS